MRRPHHLSPHPPRYLPHPFAVHIFAKKQHHVHSGRPGVGANATGMHSQRGRVVLLDVVKKSLQPISTRRPIPAAYFCRRRVPSPQRSAHRCILPSGNRGLQATEEVLGDFLGSDRAVAQGFPPRLDGVVAADPADADRHRIRTHRHRILLRGCPLPFCRCKVG